MSCEGTTKSGNPCKSKIGLKGGLCSTHQHGGNVITDAYHGVKNRINAIREGPSDKMPAKLRKFLDHHAGNKITKIQLGRKPVIKPVDIALNVLSLGKYREKQKMLNYDQVYHQYLLVTLDDGRTYKLEKNQRAVSMPAKASDYQGQMFDVPVTKELTLPQLVENASRGHESTFYKYRAGQNNCQEFTRDLIVRNGLLPGDHERVQQQDSRQLLATLPGGETVPNAITDLANVADRVIQGDGLPISLR